MSFGRIQTRPAHEWIEGAACYVDKPIYDKHAEYRVSIL